MRNYNKYKKYKKGRKRIGNVKIFFIIISFMCTLAVGYSKLDDKLTMTGTANIGTFTIQYNLNGGQNVNNPITTYNATTNAPLPIPTLTDYSFAGWYENPSCTGEGLYTTPTRK